MDAFLNTALIACPFRHRHSRQLFLSIHSPPLPGLGLCAAALVMRRFFCRPLAQVLLYPLLTMTNLNPSITPVTNALPSPTSMPPTPFILTPPPASSTSTPLLNFAILTSRSPLRSFLTLSGSSKSSDAASNSISPSSSQWYGSASGAASAVLFNRNGGEIGRVLFDGCGGNRGGGENVSS
jgi:hypothetical protein